jgi:two-component system sensor histidine kinase YesM
MRLRTKLILSYLLLIVLPLGILVFFSYVNIHRTVVQQSGIAYLEALKQAEKNIGFGIQTAHLIADQAQSSYDIQLILKTVAERPLTVSEELDYFSMLNNRVMNYESVQNVVHVNYYMLGSPRFTAPDSNFQHVNALRDEAVLQPLLKGEVRQGWYYSGDFTHHTFSRMNEMIYIKEIRDLNVLGKVLGYLMVEIDSKFVWDILKDIRLPDGTVIAVHKDGKQITPAPLGSLNLNGEAALQKLLLSDQEGIMPYKSGLGENYAIRSIVPGLGWNISLLMTEEHLGMNSRWMINFMVVLAVIVSVLAVVTAFFISGTITKRLMKLIRLIRHAEKGSWETDTSVRGNDEYSQLLRAFNKMSMKIKELIEEVYQVRISKQETEMKLLYAQINPHFLYNTLDIIHWSALRIQARDIAEITESLAKFLRHTLNGGKDHIRLAEELEGVERYLHIINYRYKGAIRLTVSIEDQVEELPIIKMIMQPLIENAVIHGIRPKADKSGEIKIRAWREESYILLMVQDDGAGLPPERLTTILEKESGGYGVKNVHQRIQVHYGQDCGLQFENAPGGGCRVIIRLKHQAES